MRRDRKGFGFWREREHNQELQSSEEWSRVNVELTSRASPSSSGIPHPQNPSLDCSSCFSGEIQWHSHLLPHQALGRGKGSAPLEE